MWWGECASRPEGGGERWSERRPGGGGAVEDVLRGKAVLGGLKKGTQVDLDGEKRGGRQEERVQQ